MNELWRLTASRRLTRATWCFRIWGVRNRIRTDNQGNEASPCSGKVPHVADRSLVGLIGLYTDPYLFYFHAGKNTIRLISRREPMLIHHLRLFQVEHLRLR